MTTNEMVPPLNREQFSYLTGCHSPYGFRVSISTEEAINYTYILKSKKYDNLYKIGRTKNLNNRYQAINNSTKFKKYGFYPIAYSPCDREHIILFALLYSDAKAVYHNPHNNRIPPEVYYLRDEDLQFIMELYHFRSIDIDDVPEEITIIKKEYKDNLGRITKVEYAEQYEHGTIA